MDPKDHKRLADNAYIKALELFENEEYSMDLLDFAHGARLHYNYSAFNKDEKEVVDNINKSEELLRRIYAVEKVIDLIKS